jgi:hypothetical protein
VRDFVEDAVSANRDQLAMMMMCLSVSITSACRREGVN